MYGLVRPLYALAEKKKPIAERVRKPLYALYAFGGTPFIFSFQLWILKVRFIMKQIIIAVVALMAGAGAALLLLSRSFTGRTRKPCMTFTELYEDNSCGEIGGLFD